MASTTMGSILKEARRLGFEDTLSEIAYPVTTDGRTERMHLPGGMGTLCGSRTSRGYQEVTLARLASRVNRCTACTRALTQRPPRIWRAPTWEALNLLGHVLEHQHQARTTCAMLQEGQGLERAVYAYRSLHALRVDLRDAKGLEGKLVELGAHVSREAGRTIIDLERGLQGPGPRKELLRIGRARLGLDVHAAEAADTLVCWHKPRTLMLHTETYPASTWQTLLAWGAKDHGDTTSVVVPRSVATWLESTSDARRGYRTAAHVVPVPGDERVVETTTGLWDPQSSGVLSDLAAAAAAARSVHTRT